MKWLLLLVALTSGTADTCKIRLVRCERTCEKEKGKPGQAYGRCLHLCNIDYQCCMDEGPGCKLH